MAHTEKWTPRLKKWHGVICSVSVFDINLRGVFILTKILIFVVYSLDLWACYSAVLALLPFIIDL